MLRAAGMSLRSEPIGAQQVRLSARAGTLRHPTSGLAEDHVQTNVVIVPHEVAFEFLLFCQRNPKPCPLVEVLEAGTTEAKLTAPGSDIRTDVPLYWMYRHGERVEALTALTDCWREDLVTFLLGCSFTFEHVLMRNGIHLPYYGTDKNVAMFETCIETEPVRPFAGPMVVTQRWVPADRVDWVVEATARYPGAHGAPVHVGDPAVLGISDLMAPDYGDPWPPQSPSDVPVYWACGVTPQAIAARSKLELMITHAPGHMFVTDLRHDDARVQLRPASA